MESLDLFRLVIPESQKRIFRQFYVARDRNLLKLYMSLERKGALPEHLKDKIEELKKRFPDIAN